MTAAAEYADRVASAQPWVNEPRQPGTVATVAEVWAHRRLLRYLGHRTLRRIYQRTVLGWGWLFIRPLLPLTLRVLVFGGLLQVASEGVPYFLFLTTGNLLWSILASGLTWGPRGLELHRGVLARVYTPTLILPMAALSPMLLDLAINLAILVLTIAYYSVVRGMAIPAPGVGTLWALAALLLTLVLVFAISLITSPWGEKARDARFTMAQVQLVWFLLTPVLYPMSAVSPAHRPWMMLNPMAAYIEAFKAGILGIGSVDPAQFGIAAGITLALLAVGFMIFRRYDTQTADL